MRPMRQLTAGIVVVATSCLFAIQAQAQQVADPAVCAHLAGDEEAIGAEGLAIEIPQSWRGRAVQTGEWLAVANARGGTLCAYLGWMTAVEPAEALTERLLGVPWEGYEAWGYLLVDTAGTGSAIDVGARPSLSPGRQRMAVVQWSDAGWGGFEGFAVYDLRWGDLSPVHVDTSLPEHADFRIDEWVDEDCVRLSAVPWARIDGDYARLAEAERDSFVAGYHGGWRLTPGSECPVFQQ